MKKNKKIRNIILISLAAVGVIVAGAFAMKVTIESNKTPVLVSTREISTDYKITQADESSFTVVQKNKDDLPNGYYKSFDELLISVNSYSYVTDSKILANSIIYPNYFKTSTGTVIDKEEKIEYEGFDSPIVTTFDTSKANVVQGAIQKNKFAYVYGSIPINNNLSNSDYEGKIYDGILLKKLYVLDYVYDDAKKNYSQLTVVVESNELEKILMIENSATNLKFIKANSLNDLNSAIRDSNVYVKESGQDPIQTEYEPISTELKQVANQRISFFNNENLNNTNGNLNFKWKGKVSYIAVEHYNFDGTRGNNYRILNLADGIYYNSKTDEFSLLNDLTLPGYYKMSFYLTTVEQQGEDDKEGTQVTKTLGSYEFCLETGLPTPSDLYDFKLEYTKYFIFVDKKTNTLLNTPKLSYVKDYFKNIPSLKDLVLSEEDMTKIYGDGYERGIMLDTNTNLMYESPFKTNPNRIQATTEDINQFFKSINDILSSAQLSTAHEFTQINGKWNNENTSGDKKLYKEDLNNITDLLNKKVIALEETDDENEKNVIKMWILFYMKNNLFGDDFIYSDTETNLIINEFSQNLEGSIDSSKIKVLVKVDSKLYAYEIYFVAE